MSDTMTNTKGRHGTWFMTLAFSIITLVTLLKDPNDSKLKDEEDYTKWAVSAVCIVLSFSSISLFAHFLVKDKFIGTMMEGGMALVTCGFAAAALPPIMDSDNGLAVGANNSIMDNNMYFSSWGMFIMSLFVLGDFLKDMRGGDSPYVPRAWLALTMTGLVTMVAASRMYEKDLNVFEDTGMEGEVSCSDSEYKDTDYCKRIKLGISIGALTGVVGAVWMLLGYFMSGTLAVVMDMLLSLVMLVFWSCGVAYITFYDESKVESTWDISPGIELGNLYFFTWGSFALSVYLMMVSMKLTYDHFMGGDETPVEQVENDQPAEEKKEKTPEDDVVPEDVVPEDVA